MKKDILESRAKKKKKKRGTYQNGLRRQHIIILSSLHHFGDEADDGGGGLIGVQLGKQVADVVRRAPLFPCDKSKKPEEKHFLL